MPHLVNYQATRKGAASLYVVIFATILFGVIALSFIRIIISERVQSSNDDLSRSAYDSALAGVEDAKRAVMECAGKNGGDISKCEGELFNGGCTSESMDNGMMTFKLNKVLYSSSTDSEVKIREENNTSGNNTDQAYTCVLLSNIVPDYRSTLTSDTRTRVVPLGINSSKLSNVKKIRFSWFSDVNAGNNNENKLGLRSDTQFPSKSDASLVPTISLSLIRANNSNSINPSGYDENSSAQTTVVLLPGASNGGGINNIAKSDLDDAALASKPHSPFLIKCDPNNPQDGFICSVDLEVDFTNVGTAIMVVSLPYGDTLTDFAVTLLDAIGGTIDFENVQIKVDSTGRANDLVRRVEARLDPADIFFPYPQYAVELTSGDDNSFSKNTWFTANCWTDEADCGNNGTGTGESGV